MQNPEVKTPPSLSNPMKTVSWPTPDGGTVASQTNISKKGVVRLELLSKANTVLHDSKGNFSFLSFWCLICSYPFIICCLVCTNITKISWNLCQQINGKKRKRNAPETLRLFSIFMNHYYSLLSLWISSQSFHILHKHTLTQKKKTFLPLTSDNCLNRTVKSITKH